MQSLQAQEEMKQFRRETGGMPPARSSVERFPLAGRKDGRKPEDADDRSMEDLFS